MNKNEIIIGDCKDVLKKYPDESIDCIVTDPPYGYSFMGLSWDKVLPSPEALTECCRVLKPGAFGFFMCAPRQDVLSRMIIRLEDAGFNVNFSSMYHTYSSGFPKSQNVSKVIDRRAGAEREVIGVREDFKNKKAAETKRGSDSKRDRNDFHDPGRGGFRDPSQSWNITLPATPDAKKLDGSYGGMQLKPAVEIIIVCMKPLSEKTYVDQALANGKGVSWLNDCRIPSETPLEVGRGGRNNKRLFQQSTPTEMGLNYNGRFPANLLVSDDVLDIDSNKFSRYFDLDSWFEDKYPNIEGNNVVENELPLRDENGRFLPVFSIPSDTLKKMQEDEVSYIPLYGRDGIRGYTIIDSDDFDLVSEYRWNLSHYGYVTCASVKIHSMRLHNLLMNPPEGFEVDHINRDPLDNRRSNLRIVTHQQNMENIPRNDTCGVYAYKDGRRTKPFWAYIQKNNKRTSLGYYYTYDEAKEAYNNATNVMFNLDNLPDQVQKTYPYLIVPKPAKSEKNKYIENKHPTVKPLKLMSYLITMGSREGDLILDPFAGSGTTLEACTLLNRWFVGIDIDEENRSLMEARGQLNTTTLETFQEIPICGL